MYQRHEYEPSFVELVTDEDRYPAGLIAAPNDAYVTTFTSAIQMGPQYTDALQNQLVRQLDAAHAELDKYMSAKPLF